MIQPIKSSFYKLLGYTFIVCIIYLAFIVLAQTFSKNSDTHKNLVKYINAEDKKQKIVFVGSSRVKAGFDPALLKRQLPEFNFYNIGLGGSSILYNYKLTEKLMSILPAKSIIFFELSDLAILPPSHYLYFNTYTDLYNLMKMQVDLSFKFNDIEKVFFSFVNVRSQLKASVYAEHAILKEIGFIKKAAAYADKPSGFININDINQSQGSLTELQQKIYAMLTDLMERAKKQDIKIVYYVALNIPKISEKKQILPVFSALPTSNKWVYSADFLKQITKGEYMYDPGHLNESGATLNSLEVAKEIKRNL